MTTDDHKLRILERIADALHRLSPAPAKPADLADGTAFHWDGRTVQAIENFDPIALDLLTEIDDQKNRLMENTRRLAKAVAAHDVLLWGSRGMGKSALPKAIIKALQTEKSDIAIVEASCEILDSLPALFEQLDSTDRPFVLFIDDIGFEESSSTPRMLRSLLEGGATARPDNVRLYVTSNRRHIVPRQMAEQDDPINPRDVIDDKLALSDRFGLRLGFHAASQDDYLAMIERYTENFALNYEKEDALLWAKQRGSRSGRVAWQYIVELAGRAGKSLS